jgi:23S rRNA pseudouridine2605 synthase
VRRDPEIPVRQQDRIAVDGVRISAAGKLYILLNKPRGVVTTASDEKARKTVYDYLPSNLPFLAPIGRLDKASEGLLLFTNDSEWGGHIAAPETHLDKTYHVQIGVRADGTIVDRLVQGVQAERERLRAKKARIVREGERNSWMEVVIDEGKNRQIRRMFDQLGIEVLRLVRIAIGPLILGNLKKGQWREVSATEKQLLDAAIRERLTRRSADIWGKYWFRT